jgi:hypothetical protein
LVVPATNFTSAFLKLGYIGIKKIMDEAEINYSRKPIVQASHLKTEIESLGQTLRRPENREIGVFGSVLKR